MISNNGMIFYVTVPNMELGEFLAEGLVSGKLAACVNIISKIKSIYQWKGKIEKDNEFLLLIKTSEEKADQLIEFIKKNHTYDVPECIGVKIDKGSDTYMKWIMDSIK